MNADERRWGLDGVVVVGFGFVYMRKTSVPSVCSVCIKISHRGHREFFNNRRWTQINADGVWMGLWLRGLASHYD
jgi:hypothetical protein